MRVVFAGLVLALMTACASAPEALLSCPAERGLYSIRGEPGASLRIFEPPHAQNAYSDLAARVEFEGETYWFAFSSSLGYSRNYVGRTNDMIEAARLEDAGGDNDEERQEPQYDGSEIHFFDARYNLQHNLPQSGDLAPAHILATGVSSSIWYSIPRRELPRAMWDLSGCAGE